MRSIIKNLFVLTAIFLSVIFVSCDSTIGGENGEPTVKLNKVSLGDAKYWNDSTASYDSSSKTVSISERYNAVVFSLENQSIKGKYFVIEYEDQVGAIRASVLYSDDTDISYALDSVKKRVFILLDSSKSLKELRIQQTGTENASLVIKQAGFVDELIMGKEPIVDSGDSVDFDSSISAIKFVKNMGVGFNLSNYFDTYTNLNDCLDVVTAWGQPKTTKDMIQQIKTTGAKTIRIPVTWYNHIIDDEYTIDPFWMSEVKKVVDWAYDEGYYVILNEHHSVHDNMSSPLKYHEGYIIRNTPEDISESKAFLTAIWEQICEAFNNSYDEHLIFETLNEPRNTSHENHMWTPAVKLSYSDSSNCSECIADHEITNTYNQLILNTIRNGGGNNAKRFVMIPSMSGNNETALVDNFEMPTDSATDKLILTFHHYPLYDTLWTSNEAYYKSVIDQIYKKIDEKFAQEGIPVVVGEIGPTATTVLQEKGLVLTDNEALLTCSYLSKATSKYGMSVVIWPREYTWENLPLAKQIVEAWKID